MADLNDLLGDQTEITSFIREEHERPYWPNQPTKCPVAKCGVQKYNSHNSFIRHWYQVHLPTKIGFTCPCCKRKRWRRDYALRHLRLKNALLDKDNLIKEEQNGMYINPEGVLPYIMNHTQRLAEKRAAISTPGDVLVTKRADCRDEVFLFDDEGNTTGKRFKSNT